MLAVGSSHFAPESSRSIRIGSGLPTMDRGQYISSYVPDESVANASSGVAAAAIICSFNQWRDCESIFSRTHGSWKDSSDVACQVVFNFIMRQPEDRNVDTEA